MVEGGGQYGEFDDAKNKLDDVFIRVRLNLCWGKEHRGCLVTASFPPSLPQEEKADVQTNRRLTRRLKSNCQNIASKDGGCRSCC